MKVALLNIRSVRNKIIHIAELLNELSLDLLCLTETWLHPSDLGIMGAAFQGSYSAFHAPRLTGAGGGLAVIYSTTLTMKQEEINLHFTSFEIMKIKFKSHREDVHLFVVYRPGHSGTDRTFLEEFNTFLESLLGVQGKIVICGDFNYWVDDPLSKPFSAEFLELLDINNYYNFVSSPTHRFGHTLDLVLSPVGMDCVENVEVLPVDGLISDHDLVTFDFKIVRPKATRKSITFRNYRNIDQDTIANEIDFRMAFADIVDSSAEGLTQHYNRSFKEIEELHFPLITKHILVKAESPWYNHTTASLRRQRRRAERKWRRLRTDDSRSEYMAARRAVVDQVQQRKVEFYQDGWTAYRGNQRKTAMLVHTLMRGTKLDLLPTSGSDNQLASDFMDFFESKIIRIREELDSVSNVDNYIRAPTPRIPPSVLFYEFHPVDEQNVKECIGRLKKPIVRQIPLMFQRL